MNVSKQEWIDWKSNSVTKEFLERLFTKREEIKEGIAEETIVEEAIQRHIGQCQAYKDVINYALYDFDTANSIEELEDDDSEGNRL